MGCVWNKVVLPLPEFRFVHLHYHAGTTNRRRVGDEVVGDSSVEDGLPVADGILRDPDQLRDCHTWEGFDAQVEDKKQE